MSSKGQMNQAESMMQAALGAFLQTRVSPTNPESFPVHPDEDILTAFVEGNLGETESRPVISHLADCSFCLHVSAELIKLESAFADDIPALPPAVPDSKGIGEVLSGIVARIFGSDEGAVFAHEEKEEEPDKEDEED